MSPSNPLPFVCPVCRGVLAQVGEVLRCPVDELTFVCEAGIWRFLPPERAAALAQFRQEYETVRRQEGRGSDDPAFYRALPFVADPAWAGRGHSYKGLLAQVIRPFAQKAQRPLRILDVGAGNGWLSHRLAAEGHVLTAVDLGVTVGAMGWGRTFITRRRSPASRRSLTICRWTTAGPIWSFLTPRFIIR
jgi:uncharacterized protein YbaR (Trm112 family)